MVHIVVSDQCKAKLESLKIHAREPYGDVVDKLIQEHNENAEKENPSFEKAVEQAEELHKKSHPTLEPIPENIK